MTSTRAWFPMSMNVQTSRLTAFREVQNGRDSGAGRCAPTVFSVCILLELGWQPTAHGPKLARHLLVYSAVGVQPAWLHTVLGCFDATMAESSRGGKERITHKTWSICFRACYRKSVLIPLLQSKLSLTGFT